MPGLPTIKKFFAVPDNPDLVLAQAKAFSRQVPLMYGILLVNSLMLAATHVHAPAFLRWVVPAILAMACLSRIVMWLRGKDRNISPLRAQRMLSSTVVVSMVLGLGFAFWSLSLYPYGGPYQQSHIAFYMGITSIGCVFCLQHLRAAATMTAITVVVPFGIFFLLSDNLVFGALAFNLMFVMAALMSILFGNYRDFAALIASRTEMQKKQEETQRLSDENYRLANVDALTDLPNRRWFDRQLAQELGKAQAEGRQIAVARLDLDSFKSVNDIFGRVTGDLVLVEVGRRIQALSKPATMVARLGADNFALIFIETTDDVGMAACGEALTEAMRPSFDMKLGHVHLSATAGFAASKPDDTADTLYDRADYVTWVAKHEMRGHALVFSDRHADDLNRFRKMEHALLSADLEAEIQIVFQPQFDISLNRTIGCEVLARWHSPVLGSVSPVEFIPMAERMGMISKITQIVLRKALAVSTKLPRSVRLSVNLSANDLASTTAIEAIVAEVSKVGKPCRVDFEITETAVMRDIEQANRGLVQLLALGSRIALDDFGTGHSSLTYVQKLPLDRIKVDKSFVSEVTSDPTSRAIVKTAVDLCRNLGISCVFEGIETEAQLAVLRDLGGRVMQGYYFGRPMAEDALFAHLESEHKARTRRRIAG